MVVVEKSFPRGGATVKKTTTPLEAKEKIIFGALQKKLRKPKSKLKDDLENMLDEERQDKIESVSAELLNPETIQDGMNIMGMVKAVDQLYLSVSLPGRMTARVSVLEISEAYTKATQKFLQNSENVENYKPLKDLYRVGELLYGRVQELKQHKHGRTYINMTLKPAEVHAELSHANVRKDFIFSGAIEEVQEHGYIIESGIKGMRSFLPLEKSALSHVVGALVYLQVMKVNHDKAASTCICKEVKVKNLKVQNQVEPNIGYLLPTTIVQFHITKRLKNGLQGTIMNDTFTGYINEHQLSEPLALPEDYAMNSTLNARILYVMPLTKFVYLTLNLHNPNVAKAGVEADDTSSLKVQRFNQTFQRGDVIANARVHRLGTGGVIFVLENKYKGIISFKSIKANYKGNYDQDELLSKYAKKTQHTVRVLGYDPMDSLYICTDDASIVNEKVLDVADLQPGQFHTAIVKERNAKVGGYTLHVGRVKGIIEKFLLVASSKPLEEKSKIRCRVVAVNSERKVVYLTNRPEYMSKNCNVLTSVADAKPNAVFTGTIVKRFDTYFLVKFFNNLKGMLHKQELSGLLATEMDGFYEGQTMPFRILTRKEEQINLGLVDDAFHLGEICPATVTHILDSGLEVKVTYADDNSEGTIEKTGLVPIRLLSDFVDLLHAKLRMFPLNVEIQVVSMLKNIFSLRDVSYFQEHATNDWHSLLPGDILKACVKNISADAEVIELFVPIRGYDKLVKVHYKMMMMGTYRQPNITLSAEQIVFVKVLSKENNTKTVTVSGKLTDIWDGDLISTGNYLNKYLKEVHAIKEAFKKQGKSIAKYGLGTKIVASFQGVREETGDWQYEVVESKLPALIKSSTVNKSKLPKLGEQQECVILWIDYSNELLYVSNKPADLEHISSSMDIPPNLVDRSGINGKVLLKLENLFICSLKKGQQPLVFCPARLHFNDFENSTSIGVKEGEFCRLAFIHKSKPIAVLENTWKLWRGIKRQRKTIEETTMIKRKKAKISNNKNTEDEQNIFIKTTANELTAKQKRKSEKIMEKNTALEKTKKAKKRTISQETECTPINHSVMFYEDKTYDESLIKKCNNSQNKKTLPGIADFWTTDLSQLNPSCSNGTASSDEDEKEESKNQAATQKKKKLSSVDKFKLQRAEEERLRTIEEKYADPNHVPESVDQFDRLVLSEPNNSKNWVNYMVFHLQSTEIDKARAVARRAIKNISFRFGDELLNIWVALLNLELLYGGKDTFDETLKEALIYNDPLKVYLRALEVLSEARKTQELVELIGVITKKFKIQQEVWRAAANAFFNIGMVERAQQMLHKALASLPEREHVNTIVVFANLNHKHGNNEMAQTLLEQVVTSYPKRVDVWTQYVDMLVKENFIDSARTILERAVIQKIPLKKMRTVFKKYLEFEERFGTEADVQKVKKLAAEYVKQNECL